MVEACPICGAASYRQKNLELHVLLEHTDRFMCWCGYVILSVRDSAAQDSLVMRNHCYDFGGYLPHYLETQLRADRG
jgi:hypothetical protein